MSRSPPDDSAESNPFATRHTRPGALPFLFADDRDASALLDSLRHQDWWGAIVGPHGSGKSTLLSTLLPLLELAQRQPVLYVLHAGERSLPHSGDPRLWNADTQVIVDGYEQLSWWSRWKLRRACRRARAGLLVTSHRPVAGLTTIFETRVDLNLARTLARRLLRDLPTEISDREISESLERCGGNLREVWFELFDLHDRKRRGS